MNSGAITPPPSMGLSDAVTAIATISVLELITSVLGGDVSVLKLNASTLEVIVSTLELNAPVLEVIVSTLELIASKVEGTDPSQ